MNQTQTTEAPTLTTNYVRDVLRYADWEAIPHLHLASEYGAATRKLDALQWHQWECENRAEAAGWDDERLNAEAEEARRVYEGRLRHEERMSALRQSLEAARTIVVYELA